MFTDSLILEERIKATQYLQQDQIYQTIVGYRVSLKLAYADEDENEFIQISRRANSQLEFI